MQTLPSDRQAGLVVIPFRGVRYKPHRASGLANVTSPPYDVISTAALHELLTADPHNIVRLILPARASGGTDPDPVGTGGSGADNTDPRSRERDSGERDSREPGAGPGNDDAGGANVNAARRLHAWLDAGVLATDPEPALYIYEQSRPGWLQRGLIGLVRLGPPERAGILPHEDVLPGPVEDRRDLMAATRSNLEPIFLVYSGGAGGWPGSLPVPVGEAGSGGHRGTADSPGFQRASAIVDLAAERCPPLATAVTPDGITHKLWGLTDPDEQAAISTDLATRSALIADGHHRYAAYLELRNLMHARGHGDGPWDYGLALLVDADAYPPRLGAIHRMIPALPLDRAARLAAAAFTVRQLPGTPAVAGTKSIVAGTEGNGDGTPGRNGDGAPGSDAGASRVPGSDAGELDRALEVLARAGQQGPAFLLAGRTGFLALTDLNRALADAAMPAGTSRRWRELDAAILRELLLAWAWGIRDNDREVLVFHDACEAVRAAVATGGTAVLSNPVPFAVVADLAAGGERVPRKSTSFGPKPRSGLVLRTFTA